VFRIGLILANIFVGVIIYNIIVLLLAIFFYIAEKDLGDEVKFKETYLICHVMGLTLISAIGIGWFLVVLGMWIYNLLLEIPIFI